MKKIIFILAVFTAFSLSAVNDNAGTSGFTFFKTTFYARAAAMANAYSAVSGDVNSVFYNPAGLAKLDGKSVSTTYMNYFDGINCGSVAYGFKYNNRFNLAVFSQFLTAKEDRTLVDEYGNYTGTDGTFGMSDLLVGINFSTAFHQTVDFGANIKYLQESLDSNTASAIALDLALIHQTVNKNLKIGIALKNLGKQISYYTDDKYKENLPKMAVVGFNYTFSQKFIANLDITKPFENDIHSGLGVEYTYNDFMKLRTGYKTEASNWRSGGNLEILSGLSAGFGINWNSIDFDYAVASYGDLGFVNQLSLGYRF